MPDIYKCDNVTDITHGDADDIAACSADLLLVFVDGLTATALLRTVDMENLYGWTVFLHVDRFHPHTANHLPLEFYLF